MCIRLSIRLAIFALALAMLMACSHSTNTNTSAALRAREQAIQNCILSGGHPHLGPDNSILCGN